MSMYHPNGPWFLDPSMEPVYGPPLWTQFMLANCAHNIISRELFANSKAAKFGGKCPGREVSACRDCTRYRC